MLACHILFIASGLRLVPESGSAVVADNGQFVPIAFTFIFPRFLVNLRTTGANHCQPYPNRTRIMKTPDWIAPTLIERRPGSLQLLTLLVMAACGLSARGQEVVAERPVEDLVPVALQQAQAAQNIVPSAAAPSFPSDTPLLQWGPTTVHAHLSYQYLYENGLPDSSGQPQTTGIHNVSPELLVELGTHWSLDYVPTWVFYSNSAFRDSVEESVRLAGWGAYEDWVLRLSQSYSTTSSPMIETGQQTDQVSWSTNFSAIYSINSKLGLELTAAQTYQSAEDFTTSHEWSTTDWLHYKIAPHLDTAVGLGVGYVTVSQGADMTYTRPQAQISWGVTGKITLSVHGGVENRRSLGDNSSDQNNPIYGASLQFQPFETTSLSLAADRVVSSSYFENQLTKNTSWNANLQQRLLQEFYLNLSVGHDTVTYVSSLDGEDTPRNDDIYTFNARLSTVLFRRLSVAAIYQNTRDSSAVTGFSLASRQVGLELGYRF